MIPETAKLRDRGQALLYVRHLLERQREAQSDVVSPRSPTADPVKLRQVAWMRYGATLAAITTLRLVDMLDDTLGEAMKREADALAIHG